MSPFVRLSNQNSLHTYPVCVCVCVCVCLCVCVCVWNMLRPDSSCQSYFMTTKNHEAPDYAICSGLLLPIMLVLNIFSQSSLSPLSTHKLIQQVPFPYNTRVFFITYSKNKAKISPAVLTNMWLQQLSKRDTTKEEPS